MKKKEQNREEIFRYGKRGARIRGFRETVRGKKWTRVQWRPAPGAHLKTESFEGWTREARKAAEAFAEGLQLTLGKPAAAAEPALVQLTLDELWERFTLAEFDHLRPATRRNYGEHWRRFVIFAGPTKLADRVSLELLDEFKVAMTRRKHSSNQIGETFKTIRRVFRWGSVERSLIAPSKVPSYRYRPGKDAKKIKMREFRADERGKVLAQFDPRSSRGWRPYVFTSILAMSANRQNATRHLTWDDVDFEHERLRWRPELAKTGEERWQPIPRAAIEALWIAYGWRLASGYEGPFVFFRPELGVRRLDSGKTGRWYIDARRVAAARESIDKPWGYTSYAKLLAKACTDAGVQREKFQGAHAFRRGVAGDLADKYGSKVAADYLGDKSVKLVEDRYILTREDQLREKGAVLEAMTPVIPTPKVQSKRNQRQEQERPGVEAEALTPEGEG